MKYMSATLKTLRTLCALSAVSVLTFFTVGCGKSSHNADTTGPIGTAGSSGPLRLAFEAQCNSNNFAVNITFINSTITCDPYTAYLVEANGKTTRQYQGDIIPTVGSVFSGSCAKGDALAFNTECTDIDSTTFSILLACACGGTTPDVVAALIGAALTII